MRFLWFWFFTLKCFYRKIRIWSMSKAGLRFWFLMRCWRFWSWFLAISSSIKINHVRTQVIFLVWCVDLFAYLLKWLHCTIATCCRRSFNMSRLRDEISWRSFDWRSCDWSNVFCWNWIRMSMESMFNQIISWCLQLLYWMASLIFLVILSKSIELSFMVLFELVYFIH